jgi:hypothetical protein
MAVGSTYPLTEMKTWNLLEGKGPLVSKTDNLTAICELIAYKMWEPRHLRTLWASMACYKDSPPPQRMGLPQRIHLCVVSSVDESGNSFVIQLCVLGFLSVD